MDALMQELPLNVAMIVRHAERLHPRKRIVTATADGVSVRTFAETIVRVRRLVAALRSVGVQPGDRVATFSWNHQQHLEVYYAAPAMGAVLHTLNIRLFPADIAWIVDHADDRIVIVDASLLPLWEQVAAKLSRPRPLIVIDDNGAALPPGALDYEQLLAGVEPVAELEDVDERSAAAMCYTSGTTGNPKGVVYSHRSTFLHAMAFCMADVVGVSERDVVLPIVPMFHANAWGFPYVALLSGASLVMPGRFLTADRLARLLVDEQVTITGGVPTILQMMLEPLRQMRERLSLRFILCGGAVVPPSLQAAYEREVGVRISQAWGMTETSPVGSVCRPLSSHPPDVDLSHTPGRPAAGIEVKLLRDDGSEVPWDGETPGELAVRGNWVAAGYYRDDSQAERFAGGWFRTGDVATMDADGYIRIVDRTKDLIKSGGEWISSVALESHLMAHPAVAEAAVIAVPHERWSERPLACVVARAGHTVTKEELLSFLSARVAKWCLPDDIVFLDEVPKTSVGKFNKKVLRERFRGWMLGLRS